MSAITITGYLLDSNGTVPDSGSTIEFLLNEPYKRADNKIAMPNAEIASVSAVTGLFSIILESTRDGVPSTRFYNVMAKLVIGGKPVNRSLGKIQIRSTPSSQNFEDLFMDALLAETTGQHADPETPAGTQDGINRVFTLSRLPILNSEMGFMNGLYMVPGVAYAIDGAVITYVAGMQPLEGDSHKFSYRIA